MLFNGLKCCDSKSLPDTIQLSSRAARDCMRARVTLPAVEAFSAPAAAATACPITAQDRRAPNRFPRFPRFLMHRSLIILSSVNRFRRQVSQTDTDDDP